MIFEVKVIPSSGQQRWFLDKASQLKCYLKSAPEQGKANRELIKFLAKTLGLPQEKTEIASGFTSRKKKIRVNKEITYSELLKALGLESGEQGALF